jgi:hypothetical protein
VRTDKWRGRVPKRGGNLPQEGRNQRNTAADLRSSGEPIRLPGGDLSGKKDGELERRSGEKRVSIAEAVQSQYRAGLGRSWSGTGPGAVARSGEDLTCGSRLSGGERDMTVTDSG